jgi:hypothetical protein
MTKYIEIELSGDEAFMLFMRTLEAKIKGAQRGVVAGAANYGLYWLRIYVPVSTAYTLRHTDASGAHWRPGGAGGGGEWEAVTGVKAGSSRHPIYAMSGTGIYAGRGIITPRLDRALASVITTSRLRGSFFNRTQPALRLSAPGRPTGYRYWVAGQRGQNFLYATYQQVRLYLNARIHTLGPELFQ